MEPEYERQFAAMQSHVQYLTQEIKDIKGRLSVDYALLHCLVRLLSTKDLATLKAAFFKETEELTVLFMYGSGTEGVSQAISHKRTSWLDVIDEELQVREDSPPEST